jgi:hypothetical protein
VSSESVTIGVVTVDTGAGGATVVVGLVVVVAVGATGGIGVVDSGVESAPSQRAFSRIA